MNYNSSLSIRVKRQNQADSLNEQLLSYLKSAPGPQEDEPGLEQRATDYLRTRLRIIERARQLKMVTPRYAAWKSCEVLWVKQNLVDAGCCAWVTAHEAPDLMLFCWFELCMTGPMGGQYNWPDPYEIVADQVKRKGGSYEAFLHNCHEV